MPSYSITFIWSIFSGATNQNSKFAGLDHRTSYVYGASRETSSLALIDLSCLQIYCRGPGGQNHPPQVIIVRRGTYCVFPSKITSSSILW